MVDRGFSGTRAAAAAIKIPDDRLANRQVRWSSRHDGLLGWTFGGAVAGYRDGPAAAVPDQTRSTAVGFCTRQRPNRHQLRTAGRRVRGQLPQSDRGDERHGGVQHHRDDSAARPRARHRCLPTRAGGQAVRLTSVRQYCRDLHFTTVVPGRPAGSDPEPKNPDGRSTWLQPGRFFLVPPVFLERHPIGLNRRASAGRRLLRYARNDSDLLNSSWPSLPNLALGSGFTAARRPGMNRRWRRRDGRFQAYFKPSHSPSGQWVDPGRRRIVGAAAWPRPAGRRKGAVA